LLRALLDLDGPRSIYQPAGSVNAQKFQIRPVNYSGCGHAPEHIWGLTDTLALPRCHPLGVRQNTSGIPRRQRAVRHQFLTAGGQVSTRVSRLRLGRLTCTTKVPTLVSTAGTQRGGARHAEAAVLSVAGQRPCPGHALGCAGHSCASTRAASTHPLGAAIV
jgi:hypothetical protein